MVDMFAGGCVIEGFAITALQRPGGDQAECEERQQDNNEANVCSRLHLLNVEATKLQLAGAQPWLPSFVRAQRQGSPFCEEQGRWYLKIMMENQQRAIIVSLQLSRGLIIAQLNTSSRVAEPGKSRISCHEARL
jgi:hypothetical protein